MAFVCYRLRFRQTAGPRRVVRIQGVAEPGLLLSCPLPTLKSLRRVFFVLRLHTKQSKM